MLPPGLGFNAVSEKALAASRDAQARPRATGIGRPMLKQNRAGLFPVHARDQSPLRACARRCGCCTRKGSSTCSLRHDRHAEATRAAVQAWGLEIVCEDPREYSSSMTAFFMPDGHDADRFRALVLEHFDMSLGVGLSKLAGRVVRIGHLAASTI